MLIDKPSHTEEAAGAPEESKPLGRYRMKRWGIIVLAGVLFLLAAGALGFRIAVEMLKGKVVEALGPGSEITELKVGWSAVELVGLDIQGPKDWPAARTLHADRVRIVPSLRSLLTDQIQIASITVEKPYLAVVRVPGKLLILPGLAERGGRKEKNQKDGGEGSARAVAISKIGLEDGIIEIFDTTVSPSPLKIRLEQIAAVAHDIAPANVQGRTRFELAALAKGKTRDGHVKLSGWVAAAGRDSSSHIVLDKVDLVSLQPISSSEETRGSARVLWI